MMQWAYGLILTLGVSTSAPVDEVPIAVPLAPGEFIVVESQPITAITLDAVCCGRALDYLCAGQHRITFIHPYTCCPVDVCFCLPCDCYCVRCGKGLCAKKIRFNIPGHFNDVVIKFHKRGGVSVKG